MMYRIESFLDDLKDITWLMLLNMFHIGGILVVVVGCIMLVLCGKEMVLDIIKGS
ncbi:MAG: hypothetical protein RR744_00170 [Cellulosilyticaceae bacterium]